MYALDKLTSNINSLMEKNSLGKRILSYIRKTREKRRQEDIAYVNNNISDLRELISELEFALEENPYHIEAFDLFSEDKDKFRNPDLLRLLEDRHNISYSHIMNNLSSFQKRVPFQTIEEYKDVKKSFDELLKKFRSSYTCD